MCMDLYRHHERCGCKIFAYVWVCEHGPRSRRCLHREYGLIEKKGFRCRYHDYRDWNPPVPEAPPPIPVRNTGADAGSPHPPPSPPLPYLGRTTTAVNPADDEESPWAAGEPDIDVAAARLSLRSHGRLAPLRRASGSSSDTDTDTSSRPPSPSRRRHYTYGQGYNSDSWEDLCHPGFASGTDTPAAPGGGTQSSSSTLARRTVALARAQRERRQRARIGDERYEARLALDAQRLRVRAEEEELRARLAEHEASLAEFGECLRHIGMPFDDEGRIPLADGDEKPELTYTTEADMEGFLFY